MPIKAVQARLVGATPELLQAVHRTHRVFNIALRQMIERYIAMRKGRHGTECQRLVEIMLERSNTFAHGLMDKLTRPRVTTRLTDEWVQISRDYLASHGPLFEQHKGFATVDGRTVHTTSAAGSKIGKAATSAEIIVTAKFWHQVCDDACAFLESYEEILARWRAERREWMEERGRWVAEHPEFMAFWNGPYSEFERAMERLRIESQERAGQPGTPRAATLPRSGLRNERWHRWYEWLISHPEILAWRRKAVAADFRAVPAADQDTIRRKNPRRDKQLPLLLDWLRRHNPELAELEHLRDTYVRRYLRFKRPPTFTLPSPDRHPRWFSMERDVFYRHADFDNGTIDLCLMDSDETGVWFLRWFTARLACDPRLRTDYRKERFKSEGRCPPFLPVKPGKMLNRPAASPDERKAGFAGAKLMPRGESVRVVFTVIDQACPPKARWVRRADRTCAADNLAGPDGAEIPLRVLAVDLGVRHIGGFVVSEGRREGNRWNVATGVKGIIQGASLPGLFEMRQHQRQLAAAKRLRGKPVRGELSFVDLQTHRTQMGGDRFKKAAAAIVELARRHDVHLIVFEDLKSLLPSARNERWINKEMLLMNRRRVVESVEQNAGEFGILCDHKLNPWLTSHLCSRCFRPGTRFSILAKDCFREHAARRDCREFGYPVWDPGGHLFRCPHCQCRLNADINAAGNLAARFFGLLPDRAMTRKDWVYVWRDGSEERRFDARTDFAAWAEAVRASRQARQTLF